MSDSSSTPPTGNNTDSLTLYTRSLHNYTLALWTESRRIAEEKARGREPAVRQPPNQPPASNAMKEKIEAAQLTPSTSSGGTDESAPTNHFAGEGQQDGSFSG